MILINLKKQPLSLPLKKIFMRVTIKSMIKTTMEPLKTTQKLLLLNLLLQMLITKEVIQNMPVQVPLWSAALSGSPDWQKIYAGYESAVDWPTAGFFRELVKVYPSAKFVLTHRDPQNWADSFGSTIYELLAGRDQAPPEMKDWLEMGAGVIAKTGFPDGLQREDLVKAFMNHNEAIKVTIPADQLLVYEVKEGWGPLCNFLNVPEPVEAFPKTNDQSEFWDRIKGKK